MSVIATVVVAAEDFVLDAALTSNPGIRVTLERVVPTGSAFVPYFWASDDSVAAIERALRSSADVASFRVVDEVDGRVLVRVDWSDEEGGILDVLSETGGTVLDAVGENEAWTFQLRFPDHRDLTAFYRQCADLGLGVEVRSVHNPGFPASVGLDFGMSPVQRETLRLAFERGYFDVPRRVNLTELAAELGVSDTAASQRLRRGIRALLDTTLPEEGPEGGPAGDE